MTYKIAEHKQRRREKETEAEQTAFVRRIDDIFEYECHNRGYECRNDHPDPILCLLYRVEQHFNDAFAVNNKHRCQSAEMQHDGEEKSAVRYAEDF